MRKWMALAAAVVAGCSTVPPESPDDPAALRTMLWSPEALRREEAAQRLLRLGKTVEGTAGEAIAELRYLQSSELQKQVDLAIRETDPQRMVWRAYHAIRQACLAREWKPVSADLDRHGFRLQEIYEPSERSKFVRFRARDAAYVNGAGDKHDLFFWIHAVPLGQPERWVVREVFVGLHVTFDAAFKTLAERDRYPRGGILAQFFELPEVKRVATVFPILEELEFTYGRIRDKESESIPAGFHLNASLRAGGTATEGGRGLYYTAESGLDPRETRSGRFLWDGFASSETLGPLTARGASFWGAGGLRPSDE